MANFLSTLKTGIELFSAGFSIYNSFQSNKINSDYYEDQLGYAAEQLDIDKERLKLQYADLRLNYEKTLNDFRTNRLSVMQQRDSYAAGMDQTELTIENLMKGQGGIEYYNALLARWQDDYDYQVATTRREGKAAYDSLMANYTGTEVMHAEAGRSGKTAELLEQQRKQDVEAFVGKDMKLDAIGGIYSQTLTELTKDLASDKHTYMTQLGVLGKSLVQEKENLKDYRTNLSEIDKEIAKYDAQIKAYEDILSGEGLANGQDLESALSGLQPGESETPETPETPDPVTEDIERDNRIIDSIVNGDDDYGTSETDHVGSTPKDWSDYTLKHNDITSNLDFIKANPDRVTTEVLDASSLGEGWSALRVTDDSGNVVEIYKDKDGRFIQYGTDKDGNKTYRLVTEDGEWKTYKADDIEDAIEELDRIDEIGDVTHAAVSLGSGLLGPVGAVVGVVDLLYQGVSKLANKSMQSSFDSAYKTAQQQAAQQLIDQYSGNWYNEQTEEEIRQAAEEAGSPTYMYDGQKYDTETGEAHEETPAIQQGLDSGEYKYDSTGAVVGGTSTEQPGPRTSGGGTGGSYSSLEERVAAEQAQVEWQPTVEERVEANIEADKTSNRVNEMIDQSSANLYGSPEEPETVEEPEEEPAPVIQTAPGSQTEPRPRTSGGGTGGSYSSLEERVAAEQAEIEKAKAEAEAAAKAEEEARAAKEKAEAEAKAQAEAEAKAKAEAEAQAQAEAEAKAAAEKAQREAEEAAKAAEEARIKAEKEAEEARKAEEQRQAEEAERAKEEARKKAKEAEEAKAKAEAEAKAAAEAQAKAEAEAKAAAEAQAKAVAEAEAAKKAQEEAAQKLLSKFSSLFSKFFGSSSSPSTQSQSEPEPKPRTTGGGTGGSYSSFEDRVEKEQAQVEAAKTSSSSSSSSSSSYSPAIQEGLDSGKYKVDENGYVVAAGSSSTPRARR